MKWARKCTGPVMITRRRSGQDLTCFHGSRWFSQGRRTCYNQMKPPECNRHPYKGSPPWRCWLFFLRRIVLWSEHVAPGEVWLLHERKTETADFRDLCDNSHTGMNFHLRRHTHAHASIHSTVEPALSNTCFKQSPAFWFQFPPPPHQIFTIIYLY